MRTFLNKFKMVKGHGEYYFVLALGIILIIIIFFIVIISFQNSTPNIPSSTPTPLPHTPSYPSTQISSNPSSTIHTTPSLRYLNIKAASKLVTREEERVPLSQSDLQAKNRILQFLPSGQNYGTVYSSNSIDIEYIQSLDLFDVTILTIDVASAKKEAEDWFKEQGMSQQGICDLPLGFYLDPNAANLLQNINFVFNPLPDGC